MPTQSMLSFSIKVNGDFSTAPSRTRIKMDEASLLSCSKCADILANLVINILESKTDKYGFIDILKHATIDPFASIRGKGPNDIIIEELKLKIHYYLKKKYGSLTKIAIQPKSIDNEDFLSVCRRRDIVGIGNLDQKSISGLLSFFSIMGITELSTDIILKEMKDSLYSERTCATILTDVIRNSKMGLSTTKKQ